jgi:hypothetical protein
VSMATRGEGALSRPKSGLIATRRLTSKPCRVPLRSVRSPRCAEDRQYGDAPDAHQVGERGDRPSFAP